MNCPFCAEEIEEGALKCRHCGEWLIPENRTSAISESGASSDLKTGELQKKISDLTAACKMAFNSGLRIFLVGYFLVSMIGLLVYLLYGVITIAFGSETVAGFFTGFGDVIKGCFVYFPVFCISCLLFGQLFFFILFREKPEPSREPKPILSTLDDPARGVEMLINIFKLPVIFAKLAYNYCKLFFLKVS